MIKQTINNIDAMCVNGLEILAVYMRGRLIWYPTWHPKDKNSDHPSEGDDNEDDIILSCYYNGYWIDEYPWTDETPWTDLSKE